MQDGFRKSHVVNVWSLRDNGDCQYDGEQLTALYDDVIRSDYTGQHKPIVVVCR